MGAQNAKTSPPAGTGHVPGFGESFNINLNTGQGVYSYKLALPNGVAKHGPALTLEYSSSHEYGNYGWGWNLGNREISRRLDSGSEVLKEVFLDSGQELLPMADGSYRSRFESQHNLYERKDDGWIIHERNGIKHVMGASENARLTNPEHPNRIYKWLAEKTIDTCGNEVHYSYLKDENIHYLDTIEYAIYKIKFNYETRPDIRTSGRLGFFTKRRNRCTDIVLHVKVDGNFVPQKTWIFGYTEDEVSGISLLQSILLKAHGNSADGSEDVLMPETKFQYQKYDPKAHHFQFVKSEGQDPPPLSENEASLIRMGNNPLPGILYNQNGSQLYWENQGTGNWRTARPIEKVPFTDSFATNGAVFGDMDASGNADMLIQGPNSLNGYYENEGKLSWGNFVAYPRNTRSFPTADRATRFADIDGDGVVDAIKSTRRAFHMLKNRRNMGWESPAVIGKTAEEIGEVNFEDLHYHMADMTGDGLPDIIKVTSGRIDYWPSLGEGRYGDKKSMINSPRMPRLQDHLDKCFLIDCNGSGCADLVFYDGKAFQVSYNQNGAAFSDTSVFDFLPAPLEGTMRAIDFYAQGKTGILYNTRSAAGLSYAYATFGSEVTGLKLMNVANGFGLESEIHYTPAIQYYNRDWEQGRKWKTHFPFPLTVVSRMKETDLVTGMVFENEMIYHDAHYNAHLRQFQGFAEVEKIEKGDDSCADKRLVYAYLMGQEYEPGNGPEHVALNGKLEKVETYALDGSAKENIPYTIEASTYKLVKAETAADGAQRVSIFLDTYTQTHLERSVDSRVEEKKYRYDAFGNVETEFTRAFGTEGGTAKPEITSEIRYQYAINKEKWILDRVAVVAVLDGLGNITGETRKYYDGEDFKGLALGKVTKGLEMREARFVMHKSPFKAHYGNMDLEELGYREEKDSAGVDGIFLDFKRSKYDAKGLRIGEMDAMGSTVEIVFDASGLFREKYISSLGENSYITDKKTASITEINGPDNAVLRMKYDAMGRLSEVFSPDNTSTIPSRSYQYDTSALPLKRTTRFYPEEDLNVFSEVITYFDGASKEIQNRIACEGGKFAVSEFNVMNPLGKVKKEFQPYFSNSEDFEIPAATIPNQTFTYDVMARPLKTINFYGGISTAVYEVFSVITSDPIDNETDIELTDRGLTNTPKIERFNVVRDRTETIVKLEADKETVLRYGINDWGQLENISDDHGIVATYLYDHQGNRLQTIHREAGERKVWYNALKQPVKGTDTNGNEINAQYDTLNRIQKLIANGNDVETYTYDIASQNGVGRLSEVAYEKGKQTFRYDTNGQIIEKSFDFVDRADELVMKFSYDRIGRRTAIEHDDGTKINYGYTPNGWVKQIPNIVKNIEYDAMGNPLAIEYENGVQTSYTFEEGGRKIKTQHTINKNNQLLEDLEYNYFSDGSLKRFTDKTTAQPITQDYEYNALNSITKNNVAQDGNTESHIYEYEDHLNLKTMGDNGAVLFREHLDKPAQISKLRNENGTETVLNYDDNGNLLNLPGRAFTYNFKNAISKLDRDDGLVAEYFYNHREDRIQKTVTDGAMTSTTFFLDKEAEYKDSQKVFFIYLGNIRVAMMRNGATSWVHSNYLGNTNFYTDAAGTKISSISYRPFGNIANTTNSLPTHTFGTHPFDEESGLYYAKKRYYAPEIGCFMSPDPVAVFMPKKVIGSVKAFQCYAYAGNDPANNVDLTGLSFWSVFGAIVGAIVGIALVVIAGPLAALIIGIGIVTLSYVLASNNVNNDFGEFMRGFMIGFNAGMNAAIGTILFGPVIGIALGVINFLAAFDSIAQNDVYKGILGWSSWLMPMSWVVTGLGLIFFVINLIVAGVTFQQVDRVKIHSISVNWQTGMFIMEGGLITYPPGGFNMGNFSFYGEGQTGVIDHELGHGLNLGAYGWVFHFVGAIDENVVQENMHDAYAEHLAESNQASPDHPPPTPQLDMWTA